MPTKLQRRFDRGVRPHLWESLRPVDKLGFWIFALICCSTNEEPSAALKQYLTAAQVAAILRVRKKMVYFWAGQGRISAYQIYETLRSQ